MTTDNNDVRFIGTLTFVMVMVMMTTAMDVRFIGTPTFVMMKMMIMLFSKFATTTTVCTLLRSFH